MPYFGGDTPTMITTLLAIKLMLFSLKIGFGDSKNLYGGTRKEPFQLICQGNGVGKCLWLINSSKLVEYLRGKGHYIDIISAISLLSMVFAT